MFETWLDRKKGHRITSNTGSPMKDTYKMHVDENGKRELRKSGVYNLYAEIQSHKDSCSIDYILARFAAGDDTALSRVQGIYGDFSEVPTTMAEVCQRVIDAKHIFDNLPIEVREQYNFSASEFFAQIDSEKTRNIFGVKDEVKENLKDVVVETQIKKDVIVDAK